MNDVAIEPRKTRRAVIWLWLLVACGVVALLAANAHLVYVASISQPACVSHFREGDTADAAGLYRAAKSSCTPTLPASAEGTAR